MKRPALIFVGFKHKTETIQAARELGFHPILLTAKVMRGARKHFDQVHKGPLLDMDFLSRVKNALQDYDVKGVISDYEHYVMHRSFIAECFAVPACSLESAAATRNKALQRQALKGLPENLDFRVVSTEAEALNALSELGGEVFVKHLSGMKSRLIFHAETPEQMKRAVNSLQELSDGMNPDLKEDFSTVALSFDYPNPSRFFLVEGCAQGRQITVSSFVGDVIRHTPSVCDVYTARDIGRDDSFLAFRILPSSLPDSETEKVHQALSKIVNRLGLKQCCVFAEFMWDEGKLSLIELASRMGGYRPEMYDAAFGLELPKAHVETALGKNPELHAEFKEYVGVVEIFPRQNGRLAGISHLKELEDDPKVSYLKQLTSFGKDCGRAQEGHRPVLRFMVHGDRYEAVYEACLKWQELIEVRVD